MCVCVCVHLVRQKYQYIFLTQECSDVQTDPGPETRKSMPPSLVIFSVSASPSFISKWLRINGFCHVWPTLAGCSGRHTWVRDRGHGEDGRSECKHSLSLNCQLGSGALSDSVSLRPQDKNVFDIVCNCVMFALLVSEGSASANRHLIVSYGRVKHSIWNSGRHKEV